MIVDCISDLHGHFPELEGGDLLILAGDLTKDDNTSSQLEFISWLQWQKYAKKVVIGGNHDNWLEGIKSDALLFSTWNSKTGEQKSYADYLCDSGTEFEGLKIWGSPWTLKFPGQNPKAMAFSLDTEEELAQKWAKIPEDTDILVTHSPYFGILDRNINGAHCGSITLHQHVSTRIRPKLSICGHIHEAYGKVEMKNDTENINYQFVNASHVNERYEPVNKPIRIEL